MSRRPVIAIAIGLLLGAVTTVLSSSDTAWKLLGIEQDTTLQIVPGAPMRQEDVMALLKANQSVRIREAATLSLSMLLLMGGFLFAVYFHQADTQSHISRKLKRIRVKLRGDLDNLKRSLPHTGILTVDNGDHALLELCEAVLKAKRVWNTRIATEMGVFDAGAHSVDKWEKSLRRAVKQGTHFFDVFGKEWEDTHLPQQRADALAPGRGVYEARILRDHIGACLNFIVLEFENGATVVWFGWIMAHGLSFDQLCIKCSHDSVSEVFKNWHRTLRVDALSKRVSPITQAQPSEQKTPPRAQ